MHWGLYYCIKIFKTFFFAEEGTFQFSEKRCWSSLIEGIVFNAVCASESNILKKGKKKKRLIRNPTNCSNLCKQNLLFSLSSVVYFPQSSGQTASHQQRKGSRKYFIALELLSLSQLNYFSKLPGNARQVALTSCCHTEKSGPFFCVVSSRLTVTFLPWGSAVAQAPEMFSTAHLILRAGSTALVSSCCSIRILLYVAID